jgi:hypothetical protein
MVSFSLEPPGTAVLLTPPANTQGAAKTVLAATTPALTMVGVLPPPLLPYAPNPGTYTQMWVSQTSRMTREEMKEDLVGYLEGLSSTSTLDYTAIQNQVVALGDWYVFLTILPNNQVCLIRLLGQHSSGLGRQTAHNCFCGLLGEKVGDQLPP